jgi:hypothetical protein
MLASTRHLGVTATRHILSLNAGQRQCTAPLRPWSDFWQCGPKNGQYLGVTFPEKSDISTKKNAFSAGKIFDLFGLVKKMELKWGSDVTFFDIRRVQTNADRGYYFSDHAERAYLIFSFS